VSTTARNAYRQMSLETASSATIIVMLYDRLLRDMTEATAAMNAHQVERAHLALKRSQEIVWGLNQALDTSVWPEGAQLRSLYQWFSEKLADANLTKRPEGLATCIPMVRDLADAWRHAAMSSSTPVLMSEARG
jgi:flagellar secretion chaperone FliS